MRIKFFHLFIYVFVLAISTNAQEKYSKVKIIPPSDLEARNNLLGIVEVDHFDIQDGAIVAEISEHAINELKSLPYQFEILIDDVAKYSVEESKKFFDKAKSGKVLSSIAGGQNLSFVEPGLKVTDIISTPTLFSTNGLPPGAMGGYYTFAEMIIKMKELETKYPSLVEISSIGTTLGFTYGTTKVNPQDIWCIKISDNVSSDESNEPEVLYLGLQHAREAITGTSLIFFAQYLVQNYSTDERVKELINNREIFIIPCTNPDGYYYNQLTNPNGGGMQRKNRKNVGSDNATSGYQKGVDINRNYGIDWADCAGTTSSCGSSDARFETYYGPSAFSEKETQAVRDFCYKRNFVAAFDQHCYGPYYSLPFGRRSYHTMPALDQKFYTHVPALMGKYNGHRAGDSKATVNYEVAGGVKDWWLLGDIESTPGEPNKKGKIYGMTGEAGGGNFWAPSSQIIELSKGLCFQNLQLAFAAGSYVELQDKNDIEVTSLSGNFGFDLRRVGLGNNPITVSLIPLENIQFSGSAVTINSLPNYYDTYSGNISYNLFPTIANGQRIKFMWKIETGGITTYETVTKFYKPDVLLFDDMESVITTNWTSTSNVTEKWAFTTTDKYSGSKSLTESAGGNYTSSTVRTVTYSNASKPLDLSNATASFLTFWVKHKAENFRDKLQIQVSTDGVTWIPVAGNLTVAELSTTNGGSLNGQPALTGIRENWAKEIVDLSAYHGAKNLKLRFNFTSDNDASNNFEKKLDDGFYLDDIKVIKSTLSLTSLPVTFLSFTGQMLANKTVQLNWEAFADEHHDYFEVERSTDGNYFSSIGKGPEYPPYILIDNHPAIGENYYRIKQTDKNGSISYSKTIHVKNQPEISVIIYPNPTSSEVSIKISQKRPQLLKLQIIDMNGQVAYTKQLQANGNVEDLKIDSKRWKSGVYLLKVLSANHEMLSINRIIKY